MLTLGADSRVVEALDEWVERPVPPAPRPPTRTWHGRSKTIPVPPDPELEVIAFADCSTTVIERQFVNRCCALADENV